MSNTPKAPFEGNRTRATALAFIALWWLQASGLIDLSQEQLLAVAGTIGGGALWFLRSAVQRTAGSEVAERLLNLLSQRSDLLEADKDSIDDHELDRPKLGSFAEARPNAEAGFSRPMALAALALVALVGTGCLGGMIDRARQPNSAVEIENQRLIAISTAERLGVQDLAGDVFIAQMGELEMPIVCVGETRAWCRDVGPLDEIWLEKGLLKSGKLHLGCRGPADSDAFASCKTYTTYIEVSRLSRGIRGKAF